MAVDPLTLAILSGLVAGTGMYMASRPKKYEINYSAYQPYSTQRETLTGAALEKRLLAAMGGDPSLIGYPEDFVSTQTAPGVAQIRANLPEQQKALQEAYGAAGMARSTLLPRDIMKATAQSGRDISSLVSQAELQALQQEKLDRARYEAATQAYTDREMAAQQAWSDYMYGGEATTAGLDRAYDQARQQQIAGAIGTGLSTGANIYGVLAPSPVGQFGQLGAGMGGMDLPALLKQAEAERRARPFVGGGLTAASSGRYV